MRSKALLTLILFILLPTFFSCHGLLRKQKPPYNYYHSNFECYSGYGWQNASEFSQYKNLWQEMRERYKKENIAKGSAKVVIVGNSLVHLFTPELLSREFPGYDIVNRGIGGDMTETLLERLPGDVFVLKPEIIIIEIGGNDLIQGKCLSFVENNIHKIIQTTKKSLPRVKIIFLSVPPTGVPTINSITPVFNQFLSRMPMEYSNVFYVDTWQYMRDPDLPTIKKDFLRERDRLHFNENGYLIWGKLLRPLL